MRTHSERKVDVITRLQREDNVWLATASAAGVPHLIPLSLAWDGFCLLLATPTDSPTVRNADSSGRVKAALDSADDVVLIDGTVEVTDFGTALPSVIDVYVRRVGWNPADLKGDWSLLRVTPETVRAWNGVAEIQGRTIMKDGVWVE